MAKRKSRLSPSVGRRQDVSNNSSLQHAITRDSGILQRNLNQERRQTRDYQELIANEQLSFAEDLRRYSPDRKKFHNVNGSIAEITYKPVFAQKKNIVHKLVLFGVMFLVSFVLGVFLSANVEIYANKYYSLLKFW